MRLSGISPESTVDGPGLRFVIFTQGCPHGCKGCHNPESWPIDGGKEFTTKEIIRMLRKEAKTKKGITLSGGEPFLQSAELVEVARAARDLGLDVVCYTGYTYEELMAESDPDKLALLDLCHILIDGKYHHEQRDISLRFCGSANQRVIDVPETKKQNKIVKFGV
ncbi:MAG: anaerobic ribonucleoside-triphosphate reductase activating protein [Defluviitaleaceae bacterium]|nr:anaerobic ribonucleoside-triphosphate reductase activating protein [Defluviitaleaceae bacterium]